LSLNDKKILITGISGFVGSVMAKRLLEQGAKVFGLKRRRADGAIPNNIKKLGIENEIRLVEGDLENIASVGMALSASNPDIIFHLGAQSFVPRSFEDPLETMSWNCTGTANLLEAIRIKDIDPVVVFAGSSEEYGLVISSQDQLNRVLEKYGVVFPEPQKIPEVPISESNPLRPMSPYAVSKVYGDHLTRNYWHSYGIKTVVSRAFNHEGAGRGIMFVTSAIASQVMKLKLGEDEAIYVGNINAFRDWSHVADIIDGYILLATKGRYGDVYNQGSKRTNSVISYLLMSLYEAGYQVDKIESFKGEKVVEDPLEANVSEIFGIHFEKNKIDDMILRGELEFELEDGGIIAHAGSKVIMIAFDEEKFRPAEVPILLSDTRKIENLGFAAKHSVRDIIADQLNYYLSARERKGYT
jgi:GDPmannose 4,6-dehydratase